MMNLTQTQGVVSLFAVVGQGMNALDAFDDAELRAGIEALNAVRLTSFVPVGPEGRWRVDEDSKLRKLIKRGDALPMAYKEASSNSDYVCAVMAIGLNKDENKPGLIMEYAGKNISEESLKRIAIRSVKETFKRRKKFGWDLGRIVVKSAGGFPENGKTACALVGAVYIPDSLSIGNN